ncbi:hypothetical protein [Novosphingobium malaysiense]|uniref:Sulfotransferase domain-containing protein n=1 Tax=Novosphingobium malaysiense TaxID=1348853 RepID=A0A0B1ZV04_9SPHN|nr:hypothetical protein [Novosphingobium malaysiense]KHK92993.1 hypothetical protein LK12_00975 [Novosphingobium malaysiense]
MQAVIANSMWRTGSTYLARQFVDNPRYRLFYEPAHEDRQSPDLPDKEEEKARRKVMNHPTFEEPLARRYLEPDPRDNTPLYERFDPRTSFVDTYEPEARGLQSFLLACRRNAEARGQIPFFGFCRSGLQHRTWDNLIHGAKVIYLWRDPREQFGSYGWPKNTYFIPSTLAQVLLSRTLEPAVDAIMHPFASRSARALLRRVPPENSLTMQRVGRALGAMLSTGRIYALFYLSWLVSNRSGAETADHVFSLSQLVEDPVLREEVEQAYDLRFDNLRPTPDRVEEAIAYDQIEREVEHIVTAKLVELELQGDVAA